VNIPLREIQGLASTLDASKPTAVICQSGYRSIAAASILQRSGFRDLFDVAGGTGAWVSAGYPVVS
jgi:rhodanese-related sulfurtransferase